MYKALPIDVAFIRATTADINGRCMCIVFLLPFALCQSLWLQYKSSLCGILSMINQIHVGEQCSINCHRFIGTGNLTFEHESLLSDQRNISMAAKNRHHIFCFFFSFVCRRYTANHSTCFGHSRENYVRSRNDVPITAAELL